MPLAIPVVTGTVTALALLSFGGGIYEMLVIDAAWPGRPDLIQPQHGGLLRRRFWIPMHVLFECTLLTALVLTWSHPAVRLPLLCGFAAHALMRVWSFAYFIPRALAFEADASAPASVEAARAWCRRSRMRLPLDAVTIGSAMTAFVVALGGRT